MPQSTSTSAVLASLVASAILFGCFVGAFVVLRMKFGRIYSPKSSFDLVPEEKKPEPLPKDPFRWVYIVLTKPHTFIMQQAGLDGYFFLRYIFVFGLTFFAGISIFVVLLPVNGVGGVGGSGNEGLSRFSISNVADHGRYYAHVFIGWVFYGAVIYIIYRELFFFNSLRCAVLATPRYAKKLSSRTILFRFVPDSMLDEKQFFKLYKGVKRIYVSRSMRKLEAKAKKRRDLAMQLEAAENKLLKLAVQNKNKAEKKGEPIEEGSDWSAYVPDKKRPTIKAKNPATGKKEKRDLIDYCKEELPLLDKEVRGLQKKFRHYRPKNSIFVEFEDQYSAQLALQSTVHHNPYRMSPSYIAMEPADVDWSNLRLFWWERIVRYSLAISAIIALIILWAIPVAFVGLISNLTFLTNRAHWLRWIYKIPPQLLGIITGLLPTVMLSLLMTLLPMFIRAMAKVAGTSSVQEMELFTQNAYFAFQIVNGFLVTTIASSAAATVTQIADSPSSAMSILATGLPKSSNFYISYLVVQGLGISGGALFQVVSFFLYYILGYLIDKTVRKKYARFTGLGTMAWGTTFPVYTNLVCITLAYSIIAPFILLFAAAGFFLLYVAYVHNLTYVFVECPDTRGAHYPRALFQTFTGIYLGQVCMLGIFAVGRGWGPIILQVVSIIFTIFCHIHISEAFTHLLQIVPVDCMMAVDGVSATPSSTGIQEYKTKVLDARKSKKRDAEKSTEIEKQKIEEFNEKDEQISDEESGGTYEVPLLASRDFKKIESTNPIVKFFRPDAFLNYRHAKTRIPAVYHEDPGIVDDKHAYDVPVVSEKMPDIWIPKDPMGLSKKEIEKFSGVVRMTDENSGFNEKGKIFFEGKSPV